MVQRVYRRYVGRVSPADRAHRLAEVAMRAKAVKKIQGCVRLWLDSTRDERAVVRALVPPTPPAGACARTASRTP